MLKRDTVFWTSRGFGIVDVNYRGSTGFGKNFVNESNFEWGRKMHDDLIDGVQWAVDEGIADPDRLGVMGWSNGGFLTNAIITATQRFKAASSGAGQAPELFSASTQVSRPAAACSRASSATLSITPPLASPRSASVAAVVKISSNTRRMAPGTGLPAAIASLMMDDGEVTVKGVVAPEGCIDPDKFLAAFLARGARIYQTEKIDSMFEPKG